MHSSKEVIRLIKKLREINKITVEDLAKKVGISKSTLSRYENEQRTFPINDVGLYAEALNTTVNHLLGIDENKVHPIILNSHDKEMVRMYNLLDDIGKQVVDSTLNSQYKRSISSNHEELRAAHMDDYSEEQQKLLKQDLDEL